MKQYILLISIFVSLAHSQAGGTAVPFLLIPTSVEGNGMGGITTTANSASPSSMMFNPAQLGMHTQSSFFSSEIYSKRTRWLPGFGLKDLWINNYSFVYGIKFALNDRTMISAGIGYSRLFLNLGNFIAAPENGPGNGKVKSAYEFSDSYSSGIGIDAGIKFAAGITMKKIESILSLTGTAEEAGSRNAKVWATDLGVILSVPIVPFLSSRQMNPSDFISPFASITGAYALNNFGGGVSYSYGNSDPLPRTARVGLSGNAGFSLRLNNISIDIVNFTVAREAENLLLSLNRYDRWEYSGSYIGNIDIIKNVLYGEANGYIFVRRGYSINFLEMVTVRNGSVEGDGNLSYKTTGFSVSTLGMSKAFASALPERDTFQLDEFIATHFEIRYNISSYSEHTLLDGTEFESFVFSFHHSLY